MRIWISSSSEYPVYDFDLEQPQTGIGAEVSEERLQDYIRIKNEYEAMQAELSELADRGEVETHPNHILSPVNKRFLESIEAIAIHNMGIAKNGTDAFKWKQVAETAASRTKLNIISPELVEQIKADFERIKREIEEESKP